MDKSTIIDGQRWWICSQAPFAYDPALDAAQSSTQAAAVQAEA